MSLAVNSIVCIKCWKQTLASTIQFKILPIHTILYRALTLFISQKKIQNAGQQPCTDNKNSNTTATLYNYKILLQTLSIIIGN